MTPPRPSVSIVCVLLLALVPLSAHGQTPGAATQPSAPLPPALAAPRWEFEAGVEPRRERLRVRVDNPSTWDTRELVPHFFQQDYVADNVWATAHVRYRESPHRSWAVEIGATPSITTHGADFDTFFQPDGNVITSGTSGEVYMRSLRAEGWLELALGSGDIQRWGYTWRRDRSIFRTPEIKTIR